MKLRRTDQPPNTSVRVFALGWRLIAIAVILMGAGLLAPSVFSQSAERAVPSHAWSPERLADALNRPMPVNNLWHLTARLRLHQTRGIPRVVNSSNPNYSVGRQDTFWVLDSNSSRYRRERAQIVCKTKHLYLYVQDSVTVNRQVACASAGVFERKTYPTDRRVFGSEWIPGVDDDPHITVFYGRVPGVGGYFSGEDEYPSAVNKFSNEREMVFINATAVSIGGADFNSTLAHEFQHMIHWHVHPQDEAWDNEGASMLAQVINGYTADGVDQAYASDPVQLDSWTDGSSVDSNYGAGYLWLDYLYEQYGVGIIHEMLATRRLSGLALAAHVLSERGTSLPAVMGNWMVANYLNDVRSGPQYGYRNSSVHVASMRTLGSGAASFSGRIRPYTPVYLRLKSGVSAVKLTGAKSVPVISAQSKKPFWWSNRCDFCDTSMTRRVSLKKASHPILRFQTWYAIEKGYDYGYVEVSTNKGATWQSLPASVTTNRNPNGGNEGNGITGSSRRVAGNREGWVPVRIDLSKYAHRTIELRFEYVTDDEMNRQSFAVRDIAIAGTSFRDRVGDPKWHRSGFVPVVRNRLPLGWIVRLIMYPRKGSPSVSAVPVPASGSVTIPIPTGKGRIGAALVVCGEAPKTTVAAPLRVTVETRAGAGGHGPRPETRSP